MWIPIKDYCNRFKKNIYTVYSHIYKKKLISKTIQGDRGKDVIAIWVEVVNG